MVMCNGLHSQKARPALQGPGRPTFAAPITPRGTAFGASETALRHAGLHSIAAGPHSLPLTAWSVRESCPRMWTV
jgi:hypothetical protein